MAFLQICIMFASLPLLALENGIAFVAGAALGTLNFLALARMLQELVYMHKGAVAVQMFSFYSRLLLTAGALYALIVMAHVSIGWLLAGISTVLINILLWGMIHLLGKTSKEA